MFKQISTSNRSQPVLIPSIYKGAQRFYFNGRGHLALDVSGDGRGLNELAGEFEILEIEYNEEGELMSFAANFIQPGSYVQRTDPPMFGGIRYNSSIPFEYGFISRFNQETNLE